MVDLNSGVIATAVNTRAANFVDLAELADNPSIYFAYVQMAFAQGKRDNAIERMDELNAIIARQTEAAGYLDGFKAKEKQAKETGANVTMTPEELAWCKANNIPVGTPPNENSLNADQWTATVRATEDHIEAIGADNQSQMVLIQDDLGQYNAFTQGASANIASGNQTMMSLAKW